jgi:hypothetical protein
MERPKGMSKGLRVIPRKERKEMRERRCEGELKKKRHEVLEG